MKFPLLLAISILSLAQLRADSGDGVIPVWDFTAKPPSYGYETWEDLGSVSSKSETGWTVDAPATGGFGMFFNDLLDLESAKKLIVRVIANPGNSGDRLMFKFHAADGKQAVWYVPLAGLELEKAIEIPIDLTKPDEVLQAEAIDMGIIRQIQVQGTFTPGSKINVTFVSLGAAQE
jgi:hypothetical protein